MVRINLINPRFLTDQHLIAEYNEILMLFSYVRKYPHTHFNRIPKNYKLGEGHILFFKNKLKYLKNRFDLIKKEMYRRSFYARKKINFNNIDRELIKDWKPSNIDKEIIKKRLIEKINLKDNYYRYYGEYKPIEFFIRMVKNAE